MVQDAEAPLSVVDAEEARQMDFNIVKRQIILEYLNLNGSDHEGEVWSLRDCINVFRYYYGRYREVFRKDHPHISNDTVSKIIEALPRIPDEYGGTLIELEPEDYKILIDAHFETQYPKCNYSIAHFMSGKIRLLRYYKDF